MARQPEVDVLATGDSMVSWVGDSLGKQLAPTPEVRVRTDEHSGSGITKPFLFSWPAYALTQVRRDPPDLTVVFLGAADGYSLRTPAGRRTSCCGAAWQDEYARHVRRMIATYSRGGNGYVYWLLLPEPRPDLTLGAGALERRRIFHAVNVAVGLAAGQMGDEVRLIRLNDVFTPNGRYRKTLVWDGRRVTARWKDGIHLSRQGASIAASLVVARMRSDGVLMRRR
jgi:hypothetical protein